MLELQTLRDLPVVDDVLGFGLMCGVELVEDQGTKKPALGLGAKVLAEGKEKRPGDLRDSILSASQ